MDKTKNTHLSLLIEIDSLKVLFDTGQTDVFFLNAEKDGLDLSLIDALVISHGHYDHTGGVPELCRINKAAAWLSSRLEAVNKRLSDLNSRT